MRLLPPFQFASSLSLPLLPCVVCERVCVCVCVGCVCVGGGVVHVQQQDPGKAGHCIPQW